MGLIDIKLKINLQNHADTRNACAHPSSLSVMKLKQVLCLIV